jgi:sugar lactone lactonase YvrE
VTETYGSLFTALQQRSVTHLMAASRRWSSWPVSGVTSCAFGGDDLRDLYITTAALGLSETDLRERPGAGGLFRCERGVTGSPASSFRG